jgi:hypothetical protein
MSRRWSSSATSAFADRSLSLPLTLVSDGLSCFSAVQGMGIRH